MVKEINHSLSSHSLKLDLSTHCAGHSNSPGATVAVNDSSRTEGMRTLFFENAQELGK